MIGGILDVKASHPTVSKAEGVFNRLILQPVPLALKRLPFEIVDGLPNLCNDCVVSTPVESHRFDVRTTMTHWRIQYSRTASRP